MTLLFGEAGDGSVASPLARWSFGGDLVGEELWKLGEIFGGSAALLPAR